MTNGWGDPGSWDMLDDAFSMPGMRTNDLVGETMGGYMHGRGGGGGRSSSDFYTNVNVVPAASLPSVRVGVANYSPLADPKPPLLEAKTSHTPTAREVASTPEFGTPDYSPVYEIDEKIKAQEGKGRSFLDGLEQQILGRDTYAEKLSGLYRQRNLARSDAESKWAQYVRANQDPNAPDPKTISVIKGNDGAQYDSGWTFGGQRYLKRIDVGVADKEKFFDSPIPDEQGRMVLGSKSDGSLIFGTVDEETEGIDASKTGEVPEGPVTTKRIAKYVPKPPSEAQLSEIEKRKAEIDNLKRDDIRSEREFIQKQVARAGEAAVNAAAKSSALLKPEELQAIREEAEAKEYARLTGKAPASAPVPPPDYRVVGRDKNGRPIVEDVRKQKTPSVKKTTEEND